MPSPEFNTTSPELNPSPEIKYQEGIISMQYEVPSRAMAGVKNKMMSATRGMAVMSTTFAG